MKLLLVFWLGIVLGVPVIHLVREFQFEGNSFEIDSLGNLYSITESSVSLIDEKGEIIQTFSQNNHGEISSIDVSNPMKIVVFYKSSGQVFFLDNQLSVHADPMDLFQLMDRDVQLIANATSNNLWLYDQFANQIIQVDRFMNITNSSGVLSGFLPHDFEPIKMIEKNEKLYVLSNKYGLAVFDVFGTFLYKIPLEGILNFQIDNEEVIYQKDNSLCFYNTRTHLEQCVSIPVSGNSIIKTNGKHYFALEGNLLKVFEF